MKRPAECRNKFLYIEFRYEEDTACQAALRIGRNIGLIFIYSRRHSVHRARSRKYRDAARHRFREAIDTSTFELMR